MHTHDTGGMATETVSIPSPKVLYISDPSEAVSLASPSDDASAGPPGGSLASPTGSGLRGKMKLKEVGLATMFIESQRRSAARSSEERQKRETAARPTALLDLFFANLCQKLHLAPSDFLKQCAEETYIFVYAEDVQQILDEMAERGEASLTLEDALTMLHQSRFPVNDSSETNGDGACWYILSSRIARDCLQFRLESEAKLTPMFRSFDGQALDIQTVSTAGMMLC